MIPTSLRYTGIDAFIVASARKFAREVDSVLGLNGIDYEDHVQAFMLCGLSQARHYRAGEFSLSSFLTVGMKRKKIDILRSYSTAARRPYHPRYRHDADMADAKSLPRDVEVCLSESGYVAEHAGVEMILGLLTKKERIFALALLQGSVEAAGRSVGWRRGAAFKHLAEIRRKLKGVWKDFGGSNGESGARRREKKR